MAARKKKNPLVNFVENNKPHGGVECAICVLPERQTIDEARKQGVAYGSGRNAVGGGMVRNWLIKEKGYTEESAPTAKCIQAHFTSKHHLEKS